MTFERGYAGWLLLCAAAAVVGLIAVGMWPVAIGVGLIVFLGWLGVSR